MDNPGTASINGSLINVNAYAAPISFTANLGGAFDAATTYSFLGWCVDIFHEITPGTMNLQYSSGALVTDQGGETLTGLQLDKISSLVNYGDYLYGHGGDSDQMAGIQGAIWRVENPTYTITGGNADIETLIGQYATQAATVLPIGAMHTIFDVDGSTQAFAVAGGVPEPGAWALLILGFGGVGAVIRSRRHRGFSSAV
ncbi:PEPxxWA-CTERM sorting domain-containing protein [Phenylobacterium sp.]|uniref:PEPxxWA-CTERM sorting domain-containing protein n=1 Tax=Phenylobacterium sp. TaxID=1871053 RepID=UPI0025DA5F2F|nr:PEPxxWA-CTERM sorting domain-containing protein [Phenylobacterium sp.]